MLIEYIAKQLVACQIMLNVEEFSANEYTIELNLEVDKSDLGKVVRKPIRILHKDRIL